MRPSYFILLFRNETHINTKYTNDLVVRETAWAPLGEFNSMPPKNPHWQRSTHTQTATSSKQIYTTYTVCYPDHTEYTTCTQSHNETKGGWINNGNSLSTKIHTSILIRNETHLNTKYTNDLVAHYFFPIFIISMTTLDLYELYFKACLDDFLFILFIFYIFLILIFFLFLYICYLDVKCARKR